MLFLPFLPSASDALGSIQQRGRGSESRSVAAIALREDFTTRAFTWVNVYGCPIAHRRIAVLFHSVPSVPAMRRGGGGAIGAVSKTFCVLLPPDALRKVTPSQNIFVLMK